MMYSPSQWQVNTGLITGKGQAGIGEQWSSTTEGETVRIELFVPEKAEMEGFAFRLGAVHQIFVDIGDVMIGGGPVTTNRDGDPRGVGSCHNDPTCFPEWANTARAVGRYIVSDGFGSGFCTGQLLNNAAEDNTPYFLTANHCFGTASAAASIDVFWLYQSATCNAAPPAVNTVPRSNGSTLLAVRGQCDGTFVRLNAIPGGLFFAGWEATDPGDQNIVVTGIHHPAGTYKRISFGSGFDQDGTCGATDTQVNGESVRVAWNRGVNPGVTEPGSSGSGIFRDIDQRLIGMLSCGSSFCGAPANFQVDTYGRFASFFPEIQQFLSPSQTGDNFEPNNVCTAASSLVASQAYTALTVTTADPDWYFLNVPPRSVLTVTVTFASNAPVSITGRIACNGQIINPVTAPNSATLSFRNETAGLAPAYINVTTAAAGQQTYSLGSTRTDVPAVAGDLCADPVAISLGTTVGTFNGTTVQATTEPGVTVSCAGTPRPDVWYSYTSIGSGQLTLDTCGSTTDTVLSVYSACPPSGTELACDDDATASQCNLPNGTVVRASYLTLDVNAGQTVLIRVQMFGASPGAYRLNLRFTPLGVSNDICSGAIPVTVGETAFNTTVARSETNAVRDQLCESNGSDGIAKDVWFRYVAPASGVLTAETCGSSFDTVLAIYPSVCPTEDDRAFVCNDDANPVCSGNALNSRVQIAVGVGAVYLIRVGGYRDPVSGDEASGSGVLRLVFNFQTTRCGPADIAGAGASDGFDGEVDNNDFVLFIQWFFDSDIRADIGIGGAEPGSDGEFDNNDFIVFIQQFFEFTGNCN
jgi:hypothetical protein